MTAKESEEQDRQRVERMRQSLERYREAENEARRKLADAVESTRIVKEKYETLLSQCEIRAVNRRKNGQIENTAGY